jgi:hypothetical protein
MARLAASPLARELLQHTTAMPDSDIMERHLHVGLRKRGIPRREAARLRQFKSGRDLLSIINVLR